MQWNMHDVLISEAYDPQGIELARRHLNSQRGACHPSPSLDSSPHKAVRIRSEA